MSIKILKYNTDNGEHSAELIRADELAFNFNYSLMRIKAKRRTTNKRTGKATFARTQIYSPTVSPGIAFAVDLNEPERISNDIKIVKHHSSNAFRVHLKGEYSISAEWMISLSSPALYTVQLLEFFLFKNGAIYKRLDTKPMFVWMTAEMNYYFPVMSVQGTKEIDLTPDDLFDIRIKHDGSIPLDQNVFHSGYIDIRLIEEKL